MYKGYDISVDFPESYNDFLMGKAVIDDHENKIKQALSSIVSTSNVIDGKKLQEQWFPQISADVFISHSHGDTELAIKLAGWLNVHFDLVAFVDSTVWKYAGNLLRVIDDKYCKNVDGKTYSYEKRNKSTSHVHVMLCAALTGMMDKTECLFFLNTPSSITASNTINEDATNSPWLYYELSMSRLIRKPLSEHTNRKALLKSKVFTNLNESKRSLDIHYPLTTSHLTEITGDDLTAWKKNYKSSIPKPDSALDLLYDNY